MSWLVNGVETELESGASGAEIGRLADRLTVRVGGKQKTAVVARQGGKTLVSYGGRVYEIEKRKAGRSGSASASSGVFIAPMPGLIVDVMVGVGDTVSKGQKLLILEAMKTQQPISAPFDGRVSQLNVQKGQQVQEGEKMISIVETGK